MKATEQYFQYVTVCGAVQDGVLTFEFIHLCMKS